MSVNNPICNEICNVYGVPNIINKPTCFKADRCTLIDPIFVTNKRRIATTFNVTCGFSDWHNIVGCVTKIRDPNNQPSKIMYRSFKKFDDDEFRTAVSRIPFHVCQVFDDVDDQYYMYSNSIYYECTR